jgi:AcrR family transcriptional regulator
MTVAKSERGRKYHSPARTMAAAETRRRVLDAAANQFTQHGYTATTIKSIALAANVSAETVSAYGPKRDLLFAAWERTFVDDNVPDFFDSSQFADVRNDPGAEALLRQIITVTVQAYERTQGIWRALSAASDVDAEVAAMVAGISERRTQDVVGLLNEVAARAGGTLRSPLELAQIATHIVSFEGHQHFVRECGWSMQQYTDWAVEHVLAEVRAALT